jgi:AraC family transcriptional regulator, positive regulator of tynA and feaB
LSYWRESICDSMLELEIEAATGSGFSARLEQCQLGPVTLNFLGATSQQVTRSRGAIARSDKTEFHLLYLAAGEFQLDCLGRSTQVYSGDCVLIDSSEPHRARCPQPTRCVILQLPRDWLRSWVLDPQSLVGRVLRAQNGWPAALAAVISNLQPGELDTLALPGGVVAEQIAALLTLSAGSPRPAVSRRDDLYRRLLRVLQDRYHEAGLSPAEVATELGISPRYLHYLFASKGTTFGRQLTRARLGRARDLLSERRFSGMSIGEIASCCGFAEASHFARCFRESFGSAPAAYRAGLGGQGTDIAH